MGYRKLGPYDLNTIITGDARELAKEIPDESVDLIFTDPPYPKKFLFCYKWLSENAYRILRPGGNCLVYMPLPYFNQVFRWFNDSDLIYHWINCYYHQSVTNIGKYWPKLINVYWKPIIWFTKGQRISNSFIADGLSAAISDKRFHEWGQTEKPALFYIEKLSTFDAIIFDPFTGGGTVPAVCKMLGRNYLAFEIDPATADLARERVANTQPPLFVVEPKQMEMEL